jgi:hypothetical protein
MLNVFLIPNRESIAFYLQEYILMSWMLSRTGNVSAKQEDL